MSIDLATIFSGVVTLIISAVGWQLKGVVADFKEAMKAISDLQVRMAVLEEKVERTEVRYLRGG